MLGAPWSIDHKEKDTAYDVVADELTHLVEITKANQLNLAEENDTLVVAHKLRFLLLLVVIAVSAAVIANPSVTFVKLTFFAVRHGGGDCQLTPSSDACRKASSDVAMYHGVSGAFSHSVAWLFALMLGSFSDGHGRRPILLAAGVLSLLTRMSLALHIFAGRSLWLYLVVEPILTIFDVHGVFLAVMNDVVRDHKQRIVANSVTMGTMICSAGLAGLAGGALSANIAVVISMVLGVAQIIFLISGFPETVPVRLRGGIENISHGDLSPCDLVRDTAQVLNKSPFIFRTTLVLFFTGLSASGFHNTFLPYLTAYLGFNQRENMQLMLACAISIVLAFGLGMRPLVAAHGEIGATRILLALKVAFYVLCVISWAPSQVFLVHALLLGPVVLIIPIMATIQSNLVKDEEQGRMQGILTAIKVLATAVGDIFFTGFYKYSTGSGANPSRISAFPPLLLSAALAVGALMLSFSLNPRDLGKSQDTYGGPKEDADFSEMSMSRLGKLEGTRRMQQGDMDDPCW